MKKVLIINFVVIVFISIISVTCHTTCVNGIFVKKIEAEEKKVATEIKRYKDAILLNMNKDGIQTIAHQLGAYKDYPKFPNDIKDTEFNSTEMMKKAFDIYKVDGVEFDVQLCNNTVYIIHDEIPKKYDNNNIQNKVFFKNNSFNTLIETFIKKRYYNKSNNKKLYIELKAKNDKYLSSNEIETIKKTLESVNKIIENYSEEEKLAIFSAISYISFNAVALDTVIRYQSNKLLKSKLYYIVGHKIPACMCKAINNPKQIRKGQTKSILQKNEITGIWFTPKTKRICKKINEVFPEKSFELYVSCYQSQEDEMKEFMRQEFNKSENNFKGIIINVKEK